VIRNFKPASRSRVPLTSEAQPCRSPTRCACRGLGAPTVISPQVMPEPLTSRTRISSPRRKSAISSLCSGLSAAISYCTTRAAVRKGRARRCTDRRSRGGGQREIKDAGMTLVVGVNDLINASPRPRLAHPSTACHPHCAHRTLQDPACRGLDEQQPGTSSCAAPATWVRWSTCSGPAPCRVDPVGRCAAASAYLGRDAFEEQDNDRAVASVLGPGSVVAHGLGDGVARRGDAAPTGLRWRGY